MSRSNTHYYNLCGVDEIGEDGYCDFHRPGRWRRSGRKCVAPAVIWGRRGAFKRKPRFPRYGWKSWWQGPPRDMKRIWQRQLRAKYKSELQRYGEVLLDGEKWLIGMYQYWA